MKKQQLNLILVIFCVNHPIYARSIFDLTHPRRIQPLQKPITNCRTIQSLSISHHISPFSPHVGDCSWMSLVHFPAFSQHLPSIFGMMSLQIHSIFCLRHFACRAPSRAASRRVPPWTRTLGISSDGKPQTKWMGKGMEGLGLQWFTIEGWKI